MASDQVRIGGQPQPGRVFGRLPGFMYPYLPQQAWLEGSVLTVERKGGAARCDLASAAEISLRHVAFGRGWSFLILHGRQEQGSAPARLVLAGPSWILLTAAQLRLLAQIISARPAEPGRKVRRVLQRLQDLADEEELRSSPVDWTFRTNPH